MSQKPLGRSWLSVAATMDKQRARGPVTDPEPRDGLCHSADEADTPSAGAAATDSADWSAAPATAISILHRHTLECIFAFLSLCELAAALRVARSWLAAVRTMRRMDAEVRRPTAPMGELAQSAMSRHVGSIWSVRLDSAALVVLADRMAHLRKLHCVLDLPPPDPHHQPIALGFPAALRSLSVHYSAGDAVAPNAADVNATIAAIGRLSLLEELHILPRAVTPQISFAPLIALPQLRSLDVRTQRNLPTTLTDAQVDQLRSMLQLRRLCTIMTPDVLRRLLQPPHELQWQQISLPNRLDDETAALLPLLPSLTEISVFVECDQFEWLGGLPNLTDVTLQFYRNVGDDRRAASMVAGLQCCTNIETLTLAYCEDLTSSHLADLLPRLPRLRVLSLFRLSIDSLAFLAQLPAANPLLSKLEVRRCARMPPSELCHVHALRGLKELVLDNSFTAPLDEHSRSQLTLPSALMPLLERFQYTAPYATA